MKQIVKLDGKWEFTLAPENEKLSRVPGCDFPVGSLLSGEVPGTIHTDLMSNDLIPDPFYRDNERRVQWVDKADWVYRKTFYVEQELLDENRLVLVAEGLDTVAEISINGREVAQTDNMHIAHRFEVSEFLEDGENEIRVCFRSPSEHAKQLEQEYGVLSHTHESHRLYMRKAQYSFGWDWGPILATSGIWKSIYLEACSGICIRDLQVDTRLTDDFKHATVNIEVATDIFAQEATGATVLVELDDRKHETALQGPEQRISVEIDEPELWWPVGYGKQKLYDLKVSVISNGEIEDTITRRIGIRNVELVQEKDQWGESFYFKVNSVPVFSKGANWIPADNFLPRVSDEKYQTLLQQATAANMNTIRIWGGGIYEQDVFYDLCDELGLLVWHDFMFACGGYPEHESYCENVRHEVEFIVKRLRHHACIFVWCGNNENEWIWYRSTGVSYQDMPGLKLFHDLIPKICARLDPDRPYWPSTPFGGDDPNSQSQGNCHQWDIWSQWQDFTTVAEDGSRFVSEFGFQAPANARTFETVTLPEDWHPQSEMMEWRNKQVEGQERLFRFLAGHVQMPNTFDDFVYKCQVVQAEALRTCLEHWRRNKARTGGAIIWQLNDCWPVSSWSLIDSELQPKLAYHAVKRAFAPVLVSLRKTESSLEVWVVNDTLAELSLTLKLSGLNFGGEAWYSRTEKINVQENSSFLALELLIRELHAPTDDSTYIKAELWQTGSVISCSRLFFKRFKHLALQRTDVKIAVEKCGDSRYALTATPDAFVKSAQFECSVPALFSDNGIDLDAGVARTIEVCLADEGEITNGMVSVRSLNP